MKLTLYVITRPEVLETDPQRNKKYSKTYQKSAYFVKKSLKIFRKISHPELEISPYVSIFIEEVTQLID